MGQVLQLLVAAAAACGALYVLWRPRWAVLLILVMFALEQLLQSYIPLLMYHRALFNVLVGILAAIAVLARFLKRDRPACGLMNPVVIGSLIIVGLSWLGLLWTPSPYQGRLFVQAALPYVGLFLICLPLLVDDLDDFRRLVTGVMLLGGLIALLVFVNPWSSYYAGRLTIDLGWYAGQQGGRGNALAIASLGAEIALIAALIRGERVTPLFNLLRAACFLVGLGLAIGSGSRGQVLAACVVGVAFYPVARRVANPRQFVLTGVGLAVLAAGLYVTFMLFIGFENRQRWDVLLMMQDTSLRYDMALGLFHAYLERPAFWLFGLGTNAFTTLSPYGETPYVHNVIVEVICELGVVGAIVLGVMMYSTWVSAVRLWRAYKDDPPLRSVAALLGALATFSLLMMLKQGSLIAHPYGLVWWVVLAAVASHERRAARETAPEWGLSGAAEPDAASTDDEGEAGEYDEYVLNRLA